MIQPLRSFTADQLTVRVYASQAEMAAEAAVLAADTLRCQIALDGEARAILASATSQIQFLEALARQPGLDWSRVTLFHMDEYLGISSQHPASFQRFLRERVELPLRPKAFHYLAGDAAEPLREAERYRRLLAAAPIDLCCLGIGENGHVAFNDPPVADFDDALAVKLVKLDEACRQQQVGEGCYPNLAAVPMYAYTLTIPTLRAALKLVCIVPERRKAEAVRATLQGPISPACPASILRRSPHCTLFLDAESASLL